MNRCMWNKQNTLPTVGQELMVFFSAQCVFSSALFCCTIIEIVTLSQTAEPLLCSAPLYFNSILTMVCNTALLVHNQTSAIMSVYSLNHYHAEWPLMTEPWINAEGCEPTDARDPSWLVAAAPNNLCLLPRTTAVNQQISALGLHQGSSAAAGCTDPCSVSRVSSLRSKTQKLQTFYFTSSSLLGWQFETLPRVSELFSTCTCSLCPPLSCHHRHIAKSARIVHLSLFQSYIY